MSLCFSCCLVVLLSASLQGALTGKRCFVMSNVVPTSGEIPLVVVEAVRSVRRPVVMVSRGEVVLNEARPKASKVVRRWRRRLVEGRRLLVRRERSSEVRRSLEDTMSINQSIRQLISVHWYGPGEGKLSDW